MRIAQWATTALAMVGVILCLIVHVLTYMGTFLFRMPSKGVPEPVLTAMLVFGVTISLLCYWSMPSPWQRPRLIGPPRQINYFMSVAGFFGIVIFALFMGVSLKQTLAGPILHNGTNGPEIVMRSGERHFISEAEYTHLKEQEDHRGGDDFYRAATAGFACILLGMAAYGVWYIVRQPTLPNPQQDPYGFGLG